MEKFVQDALGITNAIRLRPTAAVSEAIGLTA